MVRLDNRPVNRVITITGNDPIELDRRTSELLDIIDSYGGSNPYPRFNILRSENIDVKYIFVYSCTTKIGKDNIDAFDKELDNWRGRK